MSEAAPGTRQERGRVRRAAIVDAALRLFATRGYRGTSIAAVAEEAGVTDAGVLYHFNTKADLLLAVLAHHDARYAEMNAESRAVGPAEELQALREWGAVMERDADMSALLVTLSAEHLRDDSETNAYFRRRYGLVRRHYRRLFDAASAAGIIRGDVDADAEATALVAVLDGLRLQWFFSDGKVSIADAVRRYVDVTLARLAT